MSTSYFCPTQATSLFQKILMEVKFTYCKRNMFSGYSLMHFHQSIHPWNPLSYQDREHFHLSRKTARSHFVLKLLASKCFCVEIIKAKCVGREPNHQSSTPNTGSDGSGDGTWACTDASAGMGAEMKCQRALQGQEHGPFLAAPLVLDHRTKTEWVSFLVLFFRHQAGFRKREVGAG